MIATIVIIAAILLFVIVLFGALLLKLLVTILRGNAIIKCVDGIFGVVFYVSMTMLFIYTVFAIFRAFADKEFFAPVQDFLLTDMMLNNPEEKRFSKYLYEHNIVYSLFDFIF